MNSATQRKLNGTTKVDIIKIFIAKLSMMKKNNQSRREFLSKSIKTSALLAIPTIVPASVFGKNAPSNLINVASIGCGRISTSHDMTGIARYAGARIIAVCDLDKNRADAGPQALPDRRHVAVADHAQLSRPFTYAA